LRVKSEAKRQAILEVAAQAFRELGFERASMSEICARVGGSKATIYNYFPSKEVLFFAVMSLSTEAEFEAVYRDFQPSREDIAQSLRQFGERFVTFLYSPQVRAQRHLAVAESGRTELGRYLYENGVLRGQNLIADFLQAAMRLGTLRPAEPFVAAQHLCSLLESELIDRFLFQRLGEVGAEEIRGATARAISVFMAAYGPRQA
jgi:AcrR family transcriptional regulator